MIFYNSSVNPYLNLRSSKKHSLKKEFVCQWLFGKQNDSSEGEIKPQGRGNQDKAKLLRRSLLIGHKGSILPGKCRTPWDCLPEGAEDKAFALCSPTALTEGYLLLITARLHLGVCWMECCGTLRAQNEGPGAVAWGKMLSTPVSQSKPLTDPQSQGCDQRWGLRKVRKDIWIRQITFIRQFKLDLNLDSITCSVSHFGPIFFFKSLLGHSLLIVKWK